MKLKMNLKDLKAVLAKMTFLEKVDYLWTYYKWVLAIVAVVIIIINIVATGIANNRIKAIYQGILVNVAITEEGNAYLTDGWFDELEGNPERQKVELSGAYYQDPDEPLNAQTNSTLMMKITTLFMARELDYFVMDGAALEMYRDNLTFDTVENSLTPAQLEQFADEIIYCNNDEVGSYPVVVDITDTDFAQECFQSVDRVYIGFCGNTGRSALNSRFFQYLLDWE